MCAILLLVGLGRPCAGALLKAAFICAGVVELRSSQSLAEQLSTKYGCGFQLETVAKVPQGSGELTAGYREYGRPGVVAACSCESYHSGTQLGH